MIAVTVGFPRSLNPRSGIGDLLLLPSEVRSVGTRIDLCIRGGDCINDPGEPVSGVGALAAGGGMHARACWRARAGAGANHAIHGVVFAEDCLMI